MSEPDRKMGLLGAVSIGVGTMIGASIFTIFGVGVGLAGPDLPIAFLLSSFLALIVAYSYCRLSTKIVSNAGPIGFMIKGLGDTTATGAMSVLIMLSYIVSIALFLKGFAGYFLPLVGLKVGFTTMAVTETLVMTFFVGLNFFGARAVGKSELFIVAVKLLVLALLVFAGAWFVEPGRVLPVVTGGYANGVFVAASVFFLSYMGFGLITNASEDIENPTRNVPMAIYTSIAVVTAVYVLVSLVVLGNLPLAEILRAKENALAEAAKPALGGAGFLIVSVGALFSISSALNATLYGGANISYTLAKDGELPEFFERKVWFGSTEGLFVTAIAGLALAVFLNIERIASVTSAVFMIIYIGVLASHYRLVELVGGRRVIIVSGLFLVGVTFVVLMYHQFTQDLTIFFSIVALSVGAFLFEVVYRALRHRTFRT